MNYDVFKAFVDEMQHPVWIMDRELKITYINDSYRNICGKTDKDILSMDCSEILSKSTYDMIRNKCNTVIENKDIVLINDFVDDKNLKIKLVPIMNTYDEVSAIGGMYIFENVNENIFNTEDNIKKLESLKNKYKELKKLTFTDIMTQVYNRNYYEKICKKIVNEDNFPIGLIMADANGLKLVNDTLGHSEGDKLLINIAQILKEACNSEDYVFRIGGDEFIILTPNSDENKCEKLMKDILDKCKKYEDIFINPSISLGFSIIDDNNFDINKALKEAEDKVYLQKLLQKNSLSSSILNSLMISMEEKSYETEEHSNRVVKYSIEIGKRVSLSMSAMDELILVAKLHDIGKIGIDEAISLKSGNLTDEEYEIAKSHTEKGYRIVKASNQLDSVAKGVLTHHERWDGNGYPLKLKGESIPLVARIVAVADAYDIMTTDTVYKKARTRDEAIGELKINAGHQFDPKIVEVFTNYLEKSKDVLKI